MKGRPVRQRGETFYNFIGDRTRSVAYRDTVSRANLIRAAPPARAGPPAGAARENPIQDAPS